MSEAGYPGCLGSGARRVKVRRAIDPRTEERGLAEDRSHRCAPASKSWLRGPHDEETGSPIGPFAHALSADERVAGPVSLRTRAILTEEPQHHPVAPPAGLDLGLHDRGDVEQFPPLS